CSARSRKRAIPLMPAPMMRTVVRPCSRTAASSASRRELRVVVTMIHPSSASSIQPLTESRKRDARMCNPYGEEVVPMAVDAARQDARTTAALTAAKLYYLQDMTMDAIAAELGTSRSSVSRLLAHARETGLVDIRVNSPFERASQLEEQLRTRFRIAAHIVPMSGIVNEVERLERVALTAGRLLSQFIESNMVVGVAWGSTISMVSRSLVQKETHGTTFVQLNGAGNVQTSGLEYSSDILQRFGTAFGAQVEQFPVPAFFDDPDTRAAMWKERSTRRVLAFQAGMDIAVFGLGSPEAEVPSRVYVGG